MKTQVQRLVEQGITDPVLISMQLHIKRTRVETALAWIEQERIKKTRATPKKLQSRAPVKTACWTTWPLVSIDDATQRNRSAGAACGASAAPTGCASNGDTEDE